MMSKAEETLSRMRIFLDSARKMKAPDDLKIEQIEEMLEEYERDKK